MPFEPLLLAKVAYCGIFGACALTDLWWLRIPNALVAALALLFAATVVWSGDYRVSLWSHLGPAVAVFAVGAALFFWGKLGGGDVKLLTVAVLWAGIPGLPTFLIVLGIVGVVLLLVFARLREPLLMIATRLSEQTAGRIPVPKSLYVSTHLPYGVVIAAASLFIVDRIRLLG